MFLTIALTGGVAMGKSSFANHFASGDGIARERIAVFDCDLCVRELLTEQEITARIARRFGESILTTGGHIDRPRLRERVFNSAEQRAELENILHPVVRLRCERERNRALETNLVDVFLIDVPLLYESGFNVAYDHVVVVACSQNLQMQRLTQRPGITESIAEQIIGAQLSVFEKMDKADTVIWNDGSPEELNHQIDSFSRWLKTTKIQSDQTIRTMT